MPSLSVRFEHEAPGTDILVLDVILCDEVREATERLGLPKADDFLGLTREEWEAEGIEAGGGGPWRASVCPWFEPSIGLDWCRRLRKDVASHADRYAAWPDQADDVLTELDAMEALLRRALEARLRWNMVAF